MAARMLRRTSPFQALAWAFFAAGFALGTWVVHVPTVQARFSLSAGDLGLLLLAAALGAVLSMPVAVAMIPRIGSRVITLGGAFVLYAALLAVLVVGDVRLAIVCLWLVGAGIGSMDVAMNAQAVLVEGDRGRPIMSLLHGLFSVGGLVGAAVGSGFLALGAGAGLHGLAVTAGLALITALVAEGYLPPERDRSRNPRSTRGFRLWSLRSRGMRAVAAMGVINFLAMMAEGAVVDWSAVYLSSVLLTGPALAAAAFIGFSVAMAACRLSGDRLRARVGVGLLLRLSAVAAALGLAAAVLAPTVTIAVAGFTLAGVGLANMVPLAILSAATRPDVPSGVGLGVTTVLGYFGLLCGPPLIGFIAELTNLALGLGVLVAGCALILLLIPLATAAPLARPAPATP